MGKSTPSKNAQTHSSKGGALFTVRSALIVFVALYVALTATDAVGGSLAGVLGIGDSAGSTGTGLITFLAAATALHKLIAADG
jgi:hypothetical protein